MVKNRAHKFTKVDKKTQEHKAKVIAKVQELFSQYSHMCVVHIGNMQASRLFEMREKLKGQMQLLMGKHRLILRALRELDIKDDAELEKLLQHRNDVQLLFSNLDATQVGRLLQPFRQAAFLKPGDESMEEIVLHKGQLDFTQVEPTSRLAHTNNVLQLLTKLGLDVTLREGVLELQSDYTLTQQGRKVGVEQCRILKMIGRKCGSTRIQVLAEYVQKRGLKLLNA